MRCSPLAILVYLLSPLLLPISAAMGDVPAEVLLKLVGKDAGLCVVFSDMETQVPAVMNSEFAARLKKLQLYHNWMQCEAHQKFVRSRGEVEKFANRPLGRIAADMFGKSIVVAVYPSPDDRLEAVLLTETAGDESLDWFLETWNRQKSTEIETLSYGGETYFRRSRIKRNKKRTDTLYYLRYNHIFALSDKQSMMRRIIDLHVGAQIQPAEAGFKTATDAGNLYESELFRSTQLNLSAKSFVRVYFNPHACGKAVQIISNEKSDRFYRLFASCWQQCEAVGIGIRYEDGLIVESGLHYNSDNAPQEWSRFLGKVSGPPKFLERVPKHATAVFAGRYDPEAIGRLLASQASEKERRQFASFRQISQGLLLGLDLLDDVIPSLQPNWVCYFVPRLDGGKALVDGLLAIELPAVEKTATSNGNSSLRKALDNGLNTGFNLLAALKNKNRKSTKEAAVVMTEDIDGTVIRWIEQVGSYRPTYAITPDALVLSSSPKLIGDFLSTESENKLVAFRPFQELAKTHFSKKNQLFVVNLAELRGIVKQHRELLFEKHGGSSSSTVEKIKHRLASAEDVLQLFDAAFITASIDQSRVHFSFGAVLLPGSGNTDDSR